MIVDRLLAVSTRTGKASDATCCRVDMGMAVEQGEGSLMVGLRDVSGLEKRGTTFGRKTTPPC